jgi:hypothetical protein
MGIWIPSTGREVDVRLRSASDIYETPDDFYRDAISEK